MTDQFDKAQEVEQIFRDRALAHQLNKSVERPDEDEDGNRYCLSCGKPIPVTRLKAMPTAVRCINCQSLRESH